MLHPRGALAVTSALFVALTLTIVLMGTPAADVAVREAILAATSPALLAAAHVANYAGYWRVLLPGTLLLFVVFPPARRQWWLWTGLMILAPTCETLFKHLVRRARPESTAFAFPSGHATAAAAFFGAVMYLAGEPPRPAATVVRVLPGLCIALVALARVVLRAHWPADVLAGIALGLALASLASLVAERTPGTARQ